MIPESEYMPPALEVTNNFETRQLHSYIVKGEEHLQATVGVGHGIPLAQHPMTITPAQSDQLLAQDVASRLKYFMTRVPQSVRDRMTTGQIVMFISWSFNGAGWEHSDSFHMLCSGNIEGWMHGASSWVRGEHEVLAGLVRRRAVELHLASRGVKELDRIKTSLHWYWDLVPVVNSHKGKSGHLAWQGDRLIWQVA